jgi:hypothetical protein
LADPKQALAFKFDPTGPIERRPVDPGSLEPDDFIINDVALRIPSEAIRIQKRALNHEWQTLRTRTSQKAKSGHGQIVVSFEVVFRLSDFVDLDNLIRLVAGLRATPFAVVHSPYLDNQLGRPDAGDEILSKERQYQQFKPIMLALASMTFSTMGHEQAPGSVRGAFQFVWFNYLPYTNVIAFKSGEDHSRPGFPWQSQVWKNFYLPFETPGPAFPHKTGDEHSRTTTFSWREFLMVPRGDPASTALANELVQTMRRKPKQVVEELNLLLSSSISADTPRPENITQGVYDTLFRVLVQKGVVNPSDQIRAYMSQTKSGSITETVAPVLSPIVRRINSYGGFSRSNLADIEAAAAMMSRRLKDLQRLSRTGQAEFNTVTEGKFSELLDAPMVIGGKRGQIDNGGLRLFGRKQFYKVRHVPNVQEKPVAIIQQIVVSFENILATIPMMGYRYPTIQHVGSVDARVTMIIDAHNTAAADINKMYDTVENMALRYKQIPQGFTNLWVNNDFLRMLGVSEFVTENIETETITGSPGYSQVKLYLTQAGLTSQERLRDPEELTQEYVASSDQLRKEVWREVWKHTIQQEGLGQNGRTRLEPNQLEYYLVKPLNVSIDERESTFRQIVEDVVEAYNTLIQEVHAAVYDAGGIAGHVNVATLFSLKENDPNFGFIPEVRRVIKSVKDRNNAYRAQGDFSKVITGREVEQRSLEQQIKATGRVASLTGNKQLKADKELSLIQERRNRFRDMGLLEYQRSMRVLLDDVIRTKLSLPIFARRNFEQLKEKLGVEKGMMAYPDFRAQLASVAGELESVDIASDATLMKYEPDCYFWYPVHNGALADSTHGLIDEYYLTAAKVHSRKIWKDAQDRADSFFQGAYMTRLYNTENPGPYHVLVNDNEGSKLQDPLYVGDRIANATRNTDEPIHKSVVVDPNIKTPTNWFSEENPLIQAQSMCTHTTNIEDMWRGVTVTPNGDILSAHNSADPSMTLPNEIDATPNSGTNPSFKRSFNTPEFGWPIKTPPKSIPTGYKFGALRKYAGQSRRHQGVDIPEPSRGKKPWGTGDGIYGTDVRAVAAGRVVKVNTRNNRVGGMYIMIRHANNYQSEYFHLREGSIRVKIGDVVSQGQPIAQIGRTGIASSPTHLHFQVRHNGKCVDPLEVLPELDVKLLNAQRYEPSNVQRTRMAQLRETPVGRDVTSTLSSPLGLAIQEFEKSMYLGQGQTMVRAYPTFKLYFIEDDSGERRRFALDDFFSYHAVKSIRVVRSRKIAADLAVLELTNISGVLSNRKFRQDVTRTHNRQRGTGYPRTAQGEVAEESTRVSDANTAKENPIASLLLQEGINIHLKMGYSSDPDRLDTVFNGTIVGVEFSESDDLVTVVAQSYAIELIQDLKGLEKPGTKSSFGAFGWDFWGFANDAATGRILEEMLAEPEVLHFGRWEPNLGSHNPVRDLLTQRWTFNPQPADDNIFAPHPADDLSKLGDGKFFKNLKYIIYRTTIWDIFQEMTMRHPNFITLPVPYTDLGTERMTMFFGLPNQLYFARRPTGQEEFADQRMLQIQKNLTSKLFFNTANKQFAQKDIISRLIQTGARLSTLATFGTKNEIVSRVLLAGALGETQFGSAIKNVASTFFRTVRLDMAKEAGFIKPFRNYHLLTSRQHIIANNIKANSRDVANTIVIKYGEDVEVQDEGDVAIKGDEQEFTIKLDNALPTEDIRTQLGQFVNVTNPELAKRYALSLLCRNMKEIYKGSVSILGNPKMKPHDVCYMFDEYTDMMGAFEIEEVQHIFDQEHGFRTEIKPDMLVQAAEWSLLSSTEALGIVIEGALKKMTGFDGPPTSSDGVMFSVMGQGMGNALSLFGGFMAQKILNYTQLAQPVIMAPMQHHGRIFSGGVPTRKIPTSIWDTFFGEWDAQTEAGYQNWIEDKKDEIINWIKRSTGQFSVGDFFNNGGDSPE